MALTFLQAVNKSAKRANIINTNGELSAFTGHAQQHDIDVQLQAWNEVIDELASRGAFPTEVAEGTLTLVTATKSYSVPSDFVSIAEDTSVSSRNRFRSRSVSSRGPRYFGRVTAYGRTTGPFGESTAIRGRDGSNSVFINEADGSTLAYYPGGWDAMRRTQLQPSTYTGKPLYWAINKVTGNIELDTAPEVGNNGDVYKFIYNKELVLAATTDTFPFLDDVIDNLIPAVNEVWKREIKSEWNEKVYNDSMSLAAGMISQVPARASYGP